MRLDRTARRCAALLVVAWLGAGCSTPAGHDAPQTGDSGGDGRAGDPSAADGQPGDDAGDPVPASDPGPGDGGAGDPQPFRFTVVTFNTGTSDGLLHDLDTSDGYTSTEAQITNDWYGNGLSWLDAMDGAAAFFAALQPEIIGFQEIFYTGDCPGIPSQYHPGYVCESWSPGDPTVAQVILGPDYQIACHQGKPDKCLAVKKSFGTWLGCSEDLCLDGLDGANISGCGGGSRLGRGSLQLAGGGELTVINVHGNSGVGLEEQQCRVQQVDHIFVDFGGGQPALAPTDNILLGDLNTDPGRMTLFDLSARRWNDFVGQGLVLEWVTEVGNDALATYQGFSIDHVASDSFIGSCVHPGFSNGVPPVLGFTYFDHAPAVCTLTPR